MRKWRKNGVVAKTPKCEKPCKYSIFKGDVEIYEIIGVASWLDDATP